MTLDPESWPETRAVGHEMIEVMLGWLERVRERRPWTAVPAETRARLAEPVPMDGEPLAEVWAAFQRNILPYPTGNIHPRFWGWVIGTGSATASLADFLASTLNPHVAGYDQAASLVERQVIRWMAELTGFPGDCSGLLVGGATEANINGLAAARSAKAGFDVREEGLSGAPPMAVYGSDQTHSWILTACEMLGLGRRGFRAIACDADYRIDLSACRAAIETDLAAGVRPLAIVGNAGTVNTGATDDLAGLRALADAYGLWFHVDGAFGALAAWSPRTAHLAAGQERADSIAFDLHKWGYMPFEIAVALTRDPKAQTAAFASAMTGAPAYLANVSGGIAVETTWFADRGVQLSRGFRALKAWMCLKEQGVRRIGEAIARNVDQVQRLAGLVDAHPDLERLAPAPMNVACFRWAPDGRDEATLDRVNRRIVVELQTRGIAVPSQTVLGGRFAIRVANVNHRTEDADFDALVDAVAALGFEIEREAAAA